MPSRHRRRRSVSFLEGFQEGYQVGPFLGRENEAKMSLVVANHIFERRGDSVVEVRRARGEGAQSRRLEATEVIPKPGDVASPRVGQLASLARRSVAESVEWQVWSARLGRRGSDVEQEVVDVGTVVRRAVAAVARASAEAGFIVEQLLASSDLCAPWVPVTGPGVEEIEPTRGLRHVRQRLGAATRAGGVKTPDARRNELRGKQRAFEINDVLYDFGRGRLALLSARHVAGSLVDQAGAPVVAHAVAAVPVDRRASDGEIDRRHDAPPVYEPVEVGETVWIVHGDQLPLGVRPGRAAPAEYAAAQ